MLPLTALNPVYDSSFLLGNVEDCALLDYDAYWSCGCFSYDETIAHTGWKDEAQRVLPFGNQYGVRWSPFNGSSDDGSSCSCGCGCSSQTYSFSAPGFTVTISDPSINSSGVSVFVNGSYNGFSGSSCGSGSNNNTGCGAPETGLALGIEPIEVGEPDFENYVEIDVSDYLPPLPENYESLIVAPEETSSGRFSLDSLQTVLDVAGFIPGPLGMVADLANAGVSLARGDLSTYPCRIILNIREVHNEQ